MVHRTRDSSYRGFWYFWRTEWIWFILLISGFVFFIMSVALYTSFDAVFLFALNKKVALSPTSNGFPIWKDVSNNFDTVGKYYFFNVTNPKEVMKGEKPKLKEVGPFVYRAKVSKQDIDFITSNYSVSFKEFKEYYFDRNASVGSENEMISIINVPTTTAVMKVRNSNYFARSGVSLSVGSITDALFINRTVRQLLFEGYDDPLMSLSSTIKGGFHKFGFMTQRNATNPGIFNMYTGKDSPLNVNRVHSINYETNMTIWHGEECNKIQGSFGYVRPPKTKATSQYVFIPDICRPFRLFVTGSVKHKGLTLNRLEITNVTLANGEANPENACFNKDFGMPSGAQEVGPCKQGAPILMSLPHFLHADSSYQDFVEGMAPDPTKHSFYMLSEPTVGITLSVRGRLQANIYIEPVDIVGYDDFPKGALPLFWNELYVEANDSVYDFVKSVLKIPDTARTMLVIVICMSALVTCVGGFLVWRSYRVDRSVNMSNRVIYSKVKAKNGASHNNSKMSSTPQV